MPYNRLKQQMAKAHVFLDVDMHEVTTPVHDFEVRAGAGSKVVITIGPQCQEVQTLVQLLHAGVTCARVDLSWGTLEYHTRSLRNLAEAMKATRRLCSVWLDTTGREIVVRRPVEYMPSGWPRQSGETRFNVDKDMVITITSDQHAVATPTLLPVNYPGFASLVEVGQLLQVGRYLATGAEGASVVMEVMEHNETEVVCRALNAATLDGLLTVMIVHTEDEDFRGDFGLPLLTENDVDCIRKLGSQFEVDFVCLSYCNSEADIYDCRALLDSVGMAQTKVIAKIERKVAVRHFESIAHLADGIVISRGNLGLDFDAEVMALLQKRIISRCNQLGKPVLITRIVDTMVTSPRPTRAEATDVANAVLDGVDGLLLGAETLRGEYPVQTVETVLRLAHAAEQHFDYRSHHLSLMGEAFDEEVSMGRADVSVSDFNMNRSPTGSIRKGLSALGSVVGGSTGLLPRHHSSGTVPGVAASEDGGATTTSVTAAPLTAVGTPYRVGGAANSMSGGGDVPTPFNVDGSPYHAYVSSFGNLPPLTVDNSQQMNRILLTHAPYMSKLESLASSATRTAEKINAGLIVVMVQTGRTVSLVSKYRPPMPIMAVVVPQLKSTRLGWHLEGKYLARQTLVLRGVVPMLAAPMSDGSEDLLSEAVHSAYLQRLCQPNDFVVCMMSTGGAMAIRVVQVNRHGTGLKAMCGENSGLIAGEEPDIISDRSPFGAFHAPPSPRVSASGMGVSRTLSGRHAPRTSAIVGSGFVTPPSPTFGGLQTHGGALMVTTASEAQAYDDLAAHLRASGGGKAGDASPARMGAIPERR